MRVMPRASVHVTRYNVTSLFVWAMVGWVTSPFFSFKASVLCTMSCISMYWKNKNIK